MKIYDKSQVLYQLLQQDEWSMAELRKIGVSPGWLWRDMRHQKLSSPSQKTWSRLEITNYILDYYPDYWQLTEKSSQYYHFRYYRRKRFKIIQSGVLLQSFHPQDFSYYKPQEVLIEQWIWLHAPGERIRIREALKLFAVSRSFLYRFLQQMIHQQHPALIRQTQNHRTYYYRSLQKYKNPR